MSQSVINGGLDVKRSLLDAVLAGLIALIVFRADRRHRAERLQLQLRAAPAGVDYRRGDGRAVAAEPVPANRAGAQGAGAFRRRQRRRLRTAAGL